MRRKSAMHRAQAVDCGDFVFGGLPSGGIAMQTQPKSDKRQARATRARQARDTTDDTFSGGTAVRSKLPLTRPWMIGTARLWSDRRLRSERE
jgi:hypothetical protein